MIRKLTACLLLIGLLSSCGVVKVKKPPEPAPSGPLKAMTFESGNPGDEPAGWSTFSHIGGTSPDEGSRDAYKVEYTDKDKRSGEMSLLLRPRGRVKDSAEMQSQTSFCGDHPYPGSPVLVSAYIKGDGGVVNFGVNAQKPGPGGLASAQYSIKRSREWAKVTSISLPLPPSSGPVQTGDQPRICLQLGTHGEHRAWLDDLTFSKVDLASLPAEKAQAVPLDNLDMERFDRAGNLAGWTLLPNIPSGEIRPGFALRADRKVKRSGAASLQLTTDVPVDETPGDRADYCLDHQSFLGKTLRVGGWVKTDVGEGPARMGVEALPLSREEVANLSNDNLPPVGSEGEHSTFFFDESFDWTRHEFVVGVPKSAISLCISVSLDQVGSIWVDDLSVEVIDL